MWLMTPVGFFSIVQKPADQHTDMLTVRSRVRSDLLALKQLYLPGMGAIEDSAFTDYRFRTVVPRAEFQDALVRIVQDLTYSNFKSEVSKRQGAKRASVYHQVWDVLYPMQNNPAFEINRDEADSFGGVVISGGGRVLMRLPANQHEGYAWTFAKTKAKKGESPKDTAIRAVLEKTGYQSEVRAVIPGVFKGSSSATSYFIMDASHPPVEPNWQTSRLQWVRFDEARTLIRQGKNEKGQTRDITILDAAEHALKSIPYREHLNVHPEDWAPPLPMPENHAVFFPKLSYSREEMRRIRRGFFPTVMEQKWFIYFTGHRLKLHRSWTGTICFDVGFKMHEDGSAIVTDVISNHEIHGDDYRYSEEQDLQLMQDVIRFHLLEPLEEPAVDSMVKALSAALQPNYLGSPKVVGALIDQLFDKTLGPNFDKNTLFDSFPFIQVVTDAFTGKDTSYTRMPGWHSLEQMGSYINKYLLDYPEDCDHFESLVHMGLTEVTNRLDEMQKGYLADLKAGIKTDPALQFQAVRDFVVAVLLGTNTVSHPGRVLADFKWQSSQESNWSKDEYLGDFQDLTGEEEQEQSQSGAVILQVGGEGGSISLKGSKEEGQWHFWIATQEECFDEEECYQFKSGESGSDQPGSTKLKQLPLAKTWRSALALMDEYPWPILYPLQVHPEFSQKVRRALKARIKKWGQPNWDEWNSVLGEYYED